MVLYPYNLKQLEALSRLMGRFRLAHSDGAPGGPCPIESQYSLCPAILEPTLTPALLGKGYAGAAEDEGAALETLRAFVRASRRYVDGRTYRCFDEVVVAPA